ncbi:MAG: Ig-like domain-containing protein, partial [Chitinophagaceae bacterium]
MKLFASIIFCFVIIVILTITGSGCGQPIPPTGGPRDTLPPMITSTEPADSSLNFKGNKITINFNEYIALDNPFEKITFSPLPKINPQVEGKLKTVTIKIKDTLEPNTTYSIDFGESIMDINENNKLKEYRYVFSTGPKIDSGILTGRVYLAENGKTDSTLIVVLHKNNEDSTVAKEKPRYAARLNKEGDFTFRYLAPGKYYIFALKDADDQKKYDQDGEYIGFLDKPVTANQNEKILLYAFTEKPEVKKVSASPGTQAPAAAKSKDDKRLRIATNLDGGRLDILGNLVLSFENKLATFDTAKLIFTDDTYKKIPNYTITQDSSLKKLTLKHPWMENSKYNLIIQKDFAKDTAGYFTTRTDTLPFQSKKESDYGSLDIKILNLDSSEHPVL